MLYNITCHMLYNITWPLLYNITSHMLYNITWPIIYNKTWPMLYNITWHILYNLTCVQAIENVFRVCIAWYKPERGWENSRQLCKQETKSRVCITVSNSPNNSSVYIRLCKHREKVFYCFYKINFPRKNAKLFVWHWLKEKFLPVAKSCPRSLARVISSCFAKRCFPKHGHFSLKMSA